MSTVTTDSIPDGGACPRGRMDLVWILLFSLGVRLLASNGLFGSDDIVYFARAAQLADGEWTSSDYNGALRYGFNLPAAAFMALFGKSEIAANLWPLSCSLIEIGAVYAFASSVMNRRAGVFSALLLATAPLHIAVATRIHADPVVSMFITLSYVLLYFGSSRQQPTLLFASGLAIGSIFWAKEFAGVTWFSLLPMLWFMRRQWRLCIYVIAGTSTMLLLHGMLMWFIAGDPLHVFRIILRATKSLSEGKITDSAFFYLKLLFIDVRHVGLVGFFAVASAWLLYWHIRPGARQKRNGVLYAMMWWISLLVVLSVFPMSLSPLRLTMKQSNYLTLFLAPTVVLAGMVIAALPRLTGRVVLLLCMMLGMLLGALEQADYRTFAANSKAVAAFVAQHSQAVVVGSSHNANLGNTLVALDKHGSPLPEIISFRDVGDRNSLARQHIREAETVFAVLDRQTMFWAVGVSTAITHPLGCWQYVQTLEPRDLGLGNYLAGLASRLFVRIKPLSDALERLATPRSADVYRVIGKDVLCVEG